jgi:hypothetical protein
VNGSFILTESVSGAPIRSRFFTDAFGAPLLMMANSTSVFNATLRPWYQVIGVGVWCTLKMGPCSFFLTSFCCWKGICNSAITFVHCRLLVCKRSVCCLKKDFIFSFHCSLVLWESPSRCHCLKTCNRLRFFHFLLRAM